MAKDRDFNLDPITKEPGAHPVGTGVGAAAGGAAAGAVAGAFGGPVGAVIGAAAGAVLGGLGGKAAAESVNPTAEAAFWEENYHREPYYEAGRSYEDYAPAYRLGLYGRTEYAGSFDDAEAHLANHWESKKDRSTLTWPQASAASRAAWQRVDAQAGALEDVDNEDVIDTLNDLLESCRDGEYGFRECAGHTKAQDIKVLLNRHSEECRASGYELLNLIQQLGGKPDDGGTASGAVHRGWVSLRAALGTYDDKAMLKECERGEDVAVARYRKALEQNLPAHIRSVVQRQADGAQRNHDQVKALRDALKAGSR